MAALWAVVILMYPANVQSHEFVPDENGGYVERPLTLHTMTWAALMWDCGFDLLYTYEDGLALPGNWPIHGAYQVYDALGIPVY